MCGFAAEEVDMLELFVRGWEEYLERDLRVN